MIDQDTAIRIAWTHFLSQYPDGGAVMRFSFANYNAAHPDTALNPGPGDRDGWWISLEYVQRMDGNYIVCVDAETGEIYYEWWM